MSTDNTTTWSEKIGMGLVLAFGIIFAEFYWQNVKTSEFLSGLPVLAVCFIAAAGGGLGGWLLAKTPRLRLQAMVSAALLNFGGMFSFQHMFETSTRLSGGERVFGFGLGALPGVILGGIFLYLHERSLKAKG